MYLSSIYIFTASSVGAPRGPSVLQKTRVAMVSSWKMMSRSSSRRIVWLSSSYSSISIKWLGLSSLITKTTTHYVQNWKTTFHSWCMCVCLTWLEKNRFQTLNAENIDVFLSFSSFIRLFNVYSRLASLHTRSTKVASLRSNAPFKHCNFSV